MRADPNFWQAPHFSPLGEEGDPMSTPLQEWAERSGLTPVALAKRYEGARHALGTNPWVWNVRVTKPGMDDPTWVEVVGVTITEEDVARLRGDRCPECCGAKIATFNHRGTIGSCEACCGTGHEHRECVGCGERVPRFGIVDTCHECGEVCA